MPKLVDILEESDEEPEPDAVMEVPLKKVKLIVGPGGERIKLIERKSKARLQASRPHLHAHVSPWLCWKHSRVQGVSSMLETCASAWLDELTCKSGGSNLLTCVYAMLEQLFPVQWGEARVLVSGEQILKEEEELNRAFGTGPKLPVLPKAAQGEGEGGEDGPKMSKILIYGNENQCEVAQRMIEEAMDNKVGARASLLRGQSPAHPFSVAGGQACPGSLGAALGHGGCAPAGGTFGRA